MHSLLAIGRFWFVVVLSWMIAATAVADWPRFRGPNGAGIAGESGQAPIEWGEGANLKWSVDLPGKGKSSPIVVGDRVIVTCWSGMDQWDLVRHLICLDRQTGEEVWSVDIEPELIEDPYQGMFRETGYAAHTPASDGERIYAFFGRCGAYAFDMEGKKLWSQSLGTGSEPRNWGTASSPIPYKDVVIFTAAQESNAIYALDKATGDEVWKRPNVSSDSMWGTPIVVNVTPDRDDLVVGFPDHVLGLDPENGEIRWKCRGNGDGRASVFEHDGVVYAIGPGSRGGGGSLAVRVGGAGDVSDDEQFLLWRNNERGAIGTPVIYDEKIYYVSRSIVSCIDPATGERVYQKRMPAASRQTTPATEVAQTEDDAQPRGRGGFGGGGPGDRFGGGRPGGGFGGRGGGMGGQDYSSPVVADGKLYFVTRSGDVHVVAIGGEFKHLAVNSFASDGGDFSATPAIVDGQVFIRSTKKLYCVAADR